MMRTVFLFVLLALNVAANAFAAISVNDDLGHAVTMAQPARRIITLAPHTMELVHAAGGLGNIVGSGSYSNYPPVARAIPVVGDHKQIDIERVLVLKPDLVVAWRYGVPQRQIDQLRRHGIAVFISDPKKLDDIADSIVRLGKLLGHEPRAQQQAGEFRRKLAALSARFSQRPLLRVFYQVSERPLYTLNDRHLIGEAIRLCGGTNIFGALPSIAPQVSVEAVLAANPQVIISTNVAHEDRGIAFWRSYPAVGAVRRGKLFRLNPDLLDRPGPRMADGVKALCDALERAR
ncbi:MAG: cobalamin-binding protein [Burkholderiaceae bacterium]|nr:cobalamin-binding protein [Burkholderiaceae bacterium]